MKGIKGMSKRSGLLAKGTKVLLLLLLLVMHAGCPEWWPSNANRGEAYQLAIKTSAENFPNKLEEKLQDYKNHPVAVQKTLEETLYSLAKNKEHKKLPIFLTRCRQVLEKLFPAILNAINLKTKMTPLGATIRKHDTHAFNFLLLQVELDINKAGENLTSLVLALREKQFKMVEPLLNKQDIDIKTIDSSSGNTTVHLAINNTNAFLEVNRKNWVKIVETLISRILKLEPEALNLLSTQNKDRSTPLHLAIENKIEMVASSLVDKLLPQHLAIQNKDGRAPLHLAIVNFLNKKIAASLINKLPKEALGEKDKKSKIPIHLAIELENEPIALLLIDKLLPEDLRKPNEKSLTPIFAAAERNLNGAVEKLVKKLSTINDFYVTDQKGRGLLHIVCRSNNLYAFTKIFTKIATISGTKDTVARLFHKDRNGYTVFASSYLPKHIKQAWVGISNDNYKMFKEVLDIVKNNLNESQWQDITNEINTLENKKIIRKKDADELRKRVNSPGEAAPGA